MPSCEFLDIQKNSHVSKFSHRKRDRADLTETDPTPIDRPNSRANGACTWLFAQASVPVSRKLEEDPMGGDFYHKGCFIDDDNDRVLWDMMRHDAMTPMVSNFLRVRYMTLMSE